MACSVDLPLGASGAVSSADPLGTAPASFGPPCTALGSPSRPSILGAAPGSGPPLSMSGAAVGGTPVDVPLSGPCPAAVKLNATINAAALSMVILTSVIDLLLGGF